MLSVAVTIKVAVPADRVGEFGEPAVLFGDQERGQPPGWAGIDW